VDESNDLPFGLLLVSYFSRDCEICSARIGWQSAHFQKGHSNKLPKGIISGIHKKKFCLENTNQSHVKVTNTQLLHAKITNFDYLSNALIALVSNYFELFSN